MKIQLLHHDDFQAAAVHVGRAVPGHVTNPILAGVLLHAEDDHLHLSAFDFETSLVVDVEASVGEPGRVLVPGRLFADIAKMLPAQPATLELDEGACLRLKCGAGEYSLPTLPVEDYPQLPAMPEPVGEVPAKAFAAAIEQVATVASTDNTVPNLTAVLVDAGAIALRLMATDRYRMAVKDMAWQPTLTDPDVDVLIPADRLRSFARGLPKTGTVVVHADKTAGIVGLSDGTRHTTMRIFDADPVPYESILTRATAEFAATVETKTLLEATKRLAVFAADEKHGAFSLTFTDGAIEVTADSTRGMERSSGRETIPATITTPDGETLPLTEPVELAVQARWLQHALACTAVDADYVRLDVSTGMRPSLIRPAAEDGTPDDTYQHLIMPVRRQNK